jgi:hypothetical protein
VDRRIKLFGRLILPIVALTLLLSAAPAQAAPLHAALSGGAAEVPDPGDPNGSGAATVSINVKSQRVCFAIAVQDITLPALAAHIHEGEEGVAGDIVVTLKPPVEIAGTGIGLSQACVRNQPRPILRAIKANPAGYYVNVHTEDFPGGAVRGQLQTV